MMPAAATGKQGTATPHDGQNGEGDGQDSWVAEMVCAETWNQTERRPCKKMCGTGGAVNCPKCDFCHPCGQ